MGAVTEISNIPSVCQEMSGLLKVLGDTVPADVWTQCAATCVARCQNLAE